MESSTILICYDGSPEAQRAIEAAGSLVHAGRAIVLDVGPLLTTAESYSLFTPPGAGEEFQKWNSSAALERAEEGAEHARSAGFAAEARTSLSTPSWEGIVQTADEVGASVIVIGTRGLKGARALLEGSTSHQVVLHARRPVLIVPGVHGDR